MVCEKDRKGISRREFTKCAASVLFGAAGGIGLGSLIRYFVCLQTAERTAGGVPLGPTPPLRQNVCELYEKADDTDRYRAGQEVAKKILFQSDKEALRTLRLTAKNIVGISPTAKLHAVVIPVGYQDEEISSLDPAIDTTNRVYNPLGLHIARLNVSVPLGIQAIQRLPLLIDQEESKPVLSQITEALKGKPLMPVSFIVFKDTVIRGGQFRNTILISGNCPKRAYAMTHEIGHALGLGDEYFKYYRPEELWYHTTMFTTTTSSGMDTLRAKTSEPLPPAAMINASCNGYQIYGLYPEKNIMRDLNPDDFELSQLLDRDQPVFNPTQEKLLRFGVDSYVRTK